MPFDEVAFAVARSNNAATAANENSRPMGQYALLINGAAASAVIAYLSKEKIDPAVFTAVPWSLVSYAAGCVLAALAMFCMTEKLGLLEFILGKCSAWFAGRCGSRHAPWPSALVDRQDRIFGIGCMLRLGQRGFG
jgi:hypothetical protein